MNYYLGEYYIIDISIEHSTYWFRNDSVSKNGDVANVDAFGNIEYNF